MSELPKGWRRCRLCPPDDNAWPATGPFSAFTHAGTAFGNVCNACFAEHYPIREAPCSECGCIMRTRGKSDPTCRPCRRGEPPTPCMDCGEGPAGLVMTRHYGKVQCGPCASLQRHREREQERRAA